MSNILEINCQLLSANKITISCEEGYLSSKQVFEALGLKARLYMPKLNGKPMKELTSATRYNKQGNLPHDIIEVLKTIHLNKSPNASGIRFLIEFLPELVKTQGTGLDLVPVTDVIQEPQKPKIIDCDLQPLDFLDFFRKDAPFLHLLPDEINAMIGTQVVHLFDPITGKKRRTVQLKESNVGEFKKLQKLGYLNEKQVCQRFPADHIFDQRIWFNQVDTIESIKKGKITYTRKYDFASPKPWITDSLIIHAENLRSQQEREKKERAKLLLIEEMKAQHGIQKPSTPRIQPSS